MSLASQPLQTGCQEAALIMRDFAERVTRWVGFLLSNPVLQEKGSDASQNGVNCGKGHLFGVTAPKYSEKGNVGFSLLSLAIATV